MYQIAGITNDEQPVDARWRSAVHEAAHLVTAHGLGVKPVAAFMVAEGAIAVHAPCSVYERASIAAAGLVDGDLLELDELREPPHVEPVAESMATPTESPLPGEPLPVVELDRDHLSGAIDDLQCVREWATRSRDPEDWTPRARLLLARARHACSINVDALRRLATRLFTDGHVNESTIAESLTR